METNARRPAATLASVRTIDDARRRLRSMQFVPETFAGHLAALCYFADYLSGRRHLTFEQFTELSQDERDHAVRAYGDFYGAPFLSTRLRTVLRHCGIP